jgi:RNA recognition motif-containing protein
MNDAESLYLTQQSHPRSLIHLNQLFIMKTFVAGLPYDLDDDELTEIFEKFGTIVSAKVAIDKDTGKSRGFGFVDMQNDDEAKDAIENLNGISLGKKPLIVKQAEERPQSGGGSQRGPYRGGSGSGGFNRNRDGRDSRDRNR